MVTQIQRAIGLFNTRQAAEAALYQLRDSGFDMDKVSVIAHEARVDTHVGGQAVEKPKAEQAKGGAEAGAVAGTATGGLMGLLGGLGVLAIPGVGPVAEVGVVLANTLLGSGFGAAGGGLIGALIGWGVPEDRANYYNSRIYEGQEYMVVIEGTDSDIRTAQSILQTHGLHDWGVYTPHSDYAHGSAG